MTAPRVILHADMDAFYAAIEQRDRPELRGKPVIVGSSSRRGVVATASYEARRYGVHSAMPGTRARRLCPEGIFVAPRMEVYVACSEHLARIFGRYTDLVEFLSLDEAFLDVTGSQALFGDGEAIARRIRQDVERELRLTVSVGVAPCKYVAKVASDLHKPDGLTVVPPGRERQFLAPLPVSRLWGAGPVGQQRLRRAGLRTIGDVQGIGLQEMVAAFGEATGRHFFELARGIDPRPVVPERAAKSIGHELTFGQDLTTSDQCHALLLQLSEQVGRRLRRSSLLAGTVRLKVRYPDFTTFSRQKKVAPTADDLVLYRTAVAMFDRLWPGRPGIRLLGVTAAELQPAAAPQQGELFGGDPGRSRRLLEALDRIRDRFGDGAIGHGLYERRRGSPWGPEGDGADSGGGGG